MREYTDFDLTEYNSYRINAYCSKAFFPNTEEDVLYLYQKYDNLILLGSGHNVILSKEEYHQPFLIFNKNFAHIAVDVQSAIMEVEAGCFTKDICEKALASGLSGMEMFYDIPSSFGGAVVMNAGASGEEIKDVLIKVRYLDLADMNIREIGSEQLCFEYRNSFFQKNTDKIILKGWLQLEPKSSVDIKVKMETIKSSRWAKQPKEYPNAGSVFKRPKGYYVGALVDELGLKGFSIGGARISEKHGGFIINYNNAKGKDILDIIQEVKKRVEQKFGLELEIEQRII